MAQFAKNITPNSRWLGLRRLRKGYKANPFHLQNRLGNPIAFKKKAQAVAQYLAKDHWNSTADPTAPVKLTNVIPSVYYEFDDITPEEIWSAKNRLKYCKAPGPDGVENERWLYLAYHNIELLLQLFNEWWHTQIIPDEVKLAQIIQIYR